MSAKPKLKPEAAPFHLEPQDGPQLATYALIRAVYMDDLERAKAILAAEPEQINRQEPFAGLTALHIAIFRQNADMVRLIAQHPGCRIETRDNFRRSAGEMLAYTADPMIFNIVMSAIQHQIL